jgi:hypothetical protein
MNLLQRLNVVLNEGADFKGFQHKNFVKSKSIIRQLSRYNWGNSKQSMREAVKYLTDLSECDDTIARRYMRRLSEASNYHGTTLLRQDWEALGKEAKKQEQLMMEADEVDKLKREMDELIRKTKRDIRKRNKAERIVKEVGIGEEATAEQLKEAIRLLKILTD